MSEQVRCACVGPDGKFHPHCPVHGDQRAGKQASAGAQSFQQRVRSWTLKCFGQTIADDKVERNHRFLEESLELVQTLGCTQSEAHQLVDYVYGRPQGIPPQECGGVLVTLMALCNANGLTADLCGEIELARVYEKIEKIRAKQAAKPKHSPLSEVPAPAPVSALRERLAKLIEPWGHDGIIYRYLDPCSDPKCRRCCVAAALKETE